MRQAHFALVKDSTLNDEVLLQSSFEYVSSPVHTLTQSLLTLLNFGAFNVTTPLSQSPSQHQVLFRKILDSFRRHCIQTPLQLKVLSLTSFINQHPSHRDQQYSTTDPLSYDNITFPTPVKPQHSLKRSSSSTSAVSSISKKKTRLIVTAIEHIMDALGNLKKELEKDDVVDE